MTQRILVLALTCLLVLTGCIDSTTSVQVNDDGSATFEASRRIDTRFSDNYVSDDGSTFSPGESDVDRICNNMLDSSDYPDGASLKPIETSLACGASVTLEVASDDNLSESLFALEQSAFGPIASLFEPPEASEYVVERRDDQWIFKMPTPSVSQLETDFITETDAASILARSTFSYEITLPGNAIAGENNADSVEGGTFRWDVDPTSGSVLLEARTEPPEETLWERFGLLAGLAALALAVAIFSFLALRKWRSRSDSESRRLRRRPRKTEVATNPKETDAPGATTSNAATEESETDRQPNRTGAIDAAPPGKATTGTPGTNIGIVEEADSSPNPAPSLTTLPLGASKPRWDDDLQMWMSDHELEGTLFFDEKASRWTQLR